MLESKRRAIIFLVISFLFALAAGLFFLQKVKAINSELGGMTKIYVASADIPSRTVIQPDQVTTEEVPNRFLKETHVTSVEELLDKVLVVPLSSGDIITENMIKPISSARSENNRLVTLYQSERLQFDQQLEPLDRIDIIVSSRLEGSAPKTEVFMKDVLVAATIQREGNFSGIAVEIPSGDAPLLIHVQNYADSIRILKANVGKQEEIVTESVQETTTPETTEGNNETPTAEVTTDTPTGDNSSTNNN